MVLLPRHPRKSMHDLISWMYCWTLEVTVVNIQVVTVIQIIDDKSPRNLYRMAKGCQNTRRYWIGNGREAFRILRAHYATFHSHSSCILFLWSGIALDWILCTTTCLSARCHHKKSRSVKSGVLAGYIITHLSIFKKYFNQLV